MANRFRGSQQPRFMFPSTCAGHNNASHHRHHAWTIMNTKHRTRARVWRPLLVLRCSRTEILDTGARRDNRRGNRRTWRTRAAHQRVKQRFMQIYTHLCVCMCLRCAHHHLLSVPLLYRYGLQTGLAGGREGGRVFEAHT